jgi:Putative collagen-binding domain of a collagenase
MKNADALVGNAKNDNSKFCLAKAGEVYLVYLPKGGTTDLDLTGAQGGFKVSWFNPRTGGALAAGTVESVNGGGKVALGNPPGDAGEDWLAVIRKN